MNATKPERLQDFPLADSLAPIIARSELSILLAPQHRVVKLVSGHHPSLWPTHLLKPKTQLCIAQGDPGLLETRGCGARTRHQRQVEPFGYRRLVGGRQRPVEGQDSTR